ncbi:hypothetical protein JCM12681A_08320 [Streptomyces mexicanus]|jgi:hypothetical protein
MQGPAGGPTPPGRPLVRDRRRSRAGPRTPHLRDPAVMRGNRAIPVCQNAKTLVADAFFTHSLAKVRS